MKIMKKVVSLMLALVLTIGLMSIPATDVSAASKATVTSKIRIYPGDLWNQTIDVSYVNCGDKIKNLKTSSANLLARQSSQISSSSDPGTANITLYAKKAGTYKVSFDIYSRDGKTKRSSHAVTVYAKSDLPMKSFKFANSTKDLFTLTTKTKGKIAASLNKGYTLKKIQVITSDKNGEKVTKTVKNNSTITLGIYADYDNWGYDYDDNYYDSWSTDLVARTQIIITYLDKYTHLEDTTYYNIYRIAK